MPVPLVIALAATILIVGVLVYALYKTQYREG